MSSSRASNRASCSCMFRSRSVGWCSRAGTIDWGAVRRSRASTSSRSRAGPAAMRMRASCSKVVPTTGSASCSSSAAARSKGRSASCASPREISAAVCSNSRSVPRGSSPSRPRISSSAAVRSPRKRSSSVRCRCSSRNATSRLLASVEPRESAG
uniref:Uncharacterized protein n=1 Tax=Streptomyces sp. NBC_00008 TaxID=2903610 RepID=A0AAU2VNV7_9ACTN